MAPPTDDEYTYVNRDRCWQLVLEPDVNHSFHQRHDQKGHNRDGQSGDVGFGKPREHIVHQVEQGQVPRVLLWMDTQKDWDLLQKK